MEYLCHKLRKQFAPKPAKGGVTGTGEEGDAAGGAGAGARASREEKAGRGKEGAGKEVEEKEAVELEGEDRAEVTTGLGGYRQEGDEEDDEEKDDYDVSACVAVRVLRAWGRGVEGGEEEDEEKDDLHVSICSTIRVSKHGSVLEGEGCNALKLPSPELPPSSPLTYLVAIGGQQQPTLTPHPNLPP